MIQDFKRAVRVLLQDKGWTAVVLLLLALGIGANTALFSAINGLLLRPLPVANPDSLVRFRWSGEHPFAQDIEDRGISETNSAGVGVHNAFSYPMFQARYRATWLQPPYSNIARSASL